MFSSNSSQFLGLSGHSITALRVNLSFRAGDSEESSLMIFRKTQVRERRIVIRRRSLYVKGCEVLNNLHVISESIHS